MAGDLRKTLSIRVAFESVNGVGSVIIGIQLFVDNES